VRTQSIERLEATRGGGGSLLSWRRLRFACLSPSVSVAGSISLSLYLLLSLTHTLHRPGMIEARGILGHTSRSRDSYRDTLLTRNSTPPQDHHIALRIFLL